MGRRLRGCLRGRWLVLLVVVLSLPCRAQSAELILRNAQIYTMDASRSWAQALAIRQGRLIYVGNEAGLAGLRGPQTRELDLHGAMVVPGFIDSHVHPMVGGVEQGQCNLTQCKSQAEIEATIREWARTHPDPWIHGIGWQLPLFPEGNPTRQQLDRLVGDRPASFYGADGHCLWLNSKALVAANITASTRDPQGGRIERDASGGPSGTLREHAMDLVIPLLPKTTAEERRRGLTLALKLAAGFGLTGLQEAQADAEDLAVYREFDRQGRLTARVFVAQAYAPGRSVDEQLVDFRRLREECRGRHLWAGAVKLFADGVLESKTAALLIPYPDGKRVPTLIDPEQMKRVCTRLDAEGFQIHVHAIGDGAVRTTLDALAAARETNGPNGPRHHLAHLELIDPADRPRFRELGVAANFQPLWAQPDGYIEMARPWLGPERAQALYPIGSLSRTGALLVAGSDWTVSSLNPLEAIEVAVTRTDPESSGPWERSKAWLPEQLVDLPTILAAYTINGAYLAGLEHETGSLEVGKSADLVVLERNLFTIPPTEIGSVRVLLTMLEGRDVYRARELPQASGILPYAQDRP